MLLGGECSVLDDEGPLFALSDLAPEILGLPVGHPGVLVVAGELAGKPQHDLVDAAIGFAGGALRYRRAADSSAPRADLGLRSCFQLLDDGIRDALVGVLALHSRLLFVG